MTIIRTTAKARKRLGLPDQLPEPSSSSGNTLGDWTVNVVTIARKPWLLFVAERSLLPVVIDLRNRETWQPRFMTMLSTVMDALGIAHAAIDKELASMDEIHLARSNSRVVLGVMNEYAFQLDLWLRDGGFSPADVCLKLAHMPVSSLKHLHARTGIGAGWPDDVTRRLF